MQRFTLAMVMIALGVLTAEARQRVTPDKLTEPALKAHVKKFLEDPLRKEELKEFAKKLVLSEENLKYSRKGARYEIRWSIPLKPGEKLSDTEAKLFPDTLKEQLTTAVEQDGLLSSAMGIDYVVEIGSPPIVTPPIVTPPVVTPPGGGNPGGASGGGRPVPVDPLPIVVPAYPRMSSQYVWNVVPAPCGSCIPAYFHFSEVPVPVLPPAVWHGYWPADGLTVEIPPRMPSVGGVAANAGYVSLERPARLSPLSIAGMTAADAPRLFYQGQGMYTRGEYESAARHLRASVALKGTDARAWYFLALAERARGDETAALEARASAARLHKRGQPKADEIGRALERVQGPARAWLREGLDSAPPEDRRVVNR